MLGTFVVLYLFLGGAGAGALFVAAVWSLLFHRTIAENIAYGRPNATPEEIRGKALPRRLWAPGALGVLPAD